MFISELLKLREEFEVVGDVRGKGLMLGLELVSSKVSALISVCSFATPILSKESNLCTVIDMFLT